jgi:hypothetical protein
VAERHLFQETQYGPYAFIDRRVGVVIEDLLGKLVVLESGRRDRGVAVRSKGASVQARDKRGKEFTLSD